MAKRIFDFTLSLFGLIITVPIWGVFLILIFLQDYRSPFYIAPRVGKGGRPFKMIKLRSMIVGADKSGVDSTSNSDSRITAIGQIVRRFKLDELMQLINVLIGDMSLVGPRPNVKRGVDVYTAEEMQLLKVRPGVTDFASIVFSDEGEILNDKKDPDRAYDELIRPWKSRLSLLYIRRRTLFLDFQIVVLTALAIFSKATALTYVVAILGQLGADEELKKIASRSEPLYSVPPPGSVALS